MFSYDSPEIRNLPKIFLRGFESWAQVLLDLCLQSGQGGILKGGTVQRLFSQRQVSYLAARDGLAERPRLTAFHQLLHQLSTLTQPRLQLFLPRARPSLLIFHYSQSDRAELTRTVHFQMHSNSLLASCYKDYLWTGWLPWYLHETKLTNLS